MKLLISILIFSIQVNLVEFGFSVIQHIKDKNFDKSYSAIKDRGFEIYDDESKCGVKLYNKRTNQRGQLCTYESSGITIVALSMVLNVDVGCVLYMSNKDNKHINNNPHKSLAGTVHCMYKEKITCKREVRDTTNNSVWVLEICEAGNLYILSMINYE